MGKWSTYRRRGTVQEPAAPPPSEVILAQNAAAPVNPLAEFAAIANQTATVVMNAGIVITGAGATLTRARFHLQRNATLAQTVTAAVWTNAAGLPALPRLVTGTPVPASTIPTSHADVEFPIAGTVGPGTLMLGLVLSTKLASGGDLYAYYTGTFASGIYAKWTVAETVWVGTTATTWRLWFQLLGYQL